MKGISEQISHMVYWLCKWWCSWYDGLIGRTCQSFLDVNKRRQDAAHDGLRPAGKAYQQSRLFSKTHEQESSMAEYYYFFKKFTAFCALKIWDYFTLNIKVKWPRMARRTLLPKVFARLPTWVRFHSKSIGFNRTSVHPITISALLGKLFFFFFTIFLESHGQILMLNKKAYLTVYPIIHPKSIGLRF